MSLGDVIQLPREQSARLAAFAQSVLGIEISVQEVRRVLGGTNLHFALVGADGGVIGLKAVTRVAEGAQNEETVSELGLLLNAPNCCHVRMAVPPESITLFSGQTVSVSTWLYPSRPLAALNAPDIAVLRQTPNCAIQVGEWIAFGILFGIQDRHLGNWVVNLEAGLLAMVDNEAAFSQVSPADYRAVAELTAEISRLKADRLTHPAARAIEQMWTRFLERKEGVREILGRRIGVQKFDSAMWNRTPSEAACWIIDNI